MACIETANAKGRNGVSERKMHSNWFPSVKTKKSKLGQHYRQSTGKWIWISKVSTLLV